MDEEPLKGIEQAKIDAERNKDILRATLASLPEIRFLNSIWAARRVQSDSPTSGLAILQGVPSEAITTEIGNPNAIYPWELELLVNERLAIPRPALYQSLTPETWEQIATLVNLVRNIENDESIVFHEPEDILDQIFLIGGRQFDWQQGFLTKQEIFRSTFVYGQGECAKHFERKFGIEIDTFTATCFAYFALFSSHPQARKNTNFSAINIENSDRDRVLAMVSHHIRDAKNLARSKRHPDGEIAYQPSVLRTHPIIGVTAASGQLLCPLPDLLMNRMTFGLFYDVIDGGGPIRDEIGTRFEEYVHLNISHFLPELEVEREFSYNSRFGEVKSPDVLLSSQDDELIALLECKASRLPHSARFAAFDPTERGYRDMIKGVKQIWRFIADIRTGRVKRKKADDTVGAVITLDSWFVAAPARQEKILEVAKEECSNHPSILKADMVPIAFVYMPEFERRLAYGDAELVLRTLRRLSQKAMRGFSFDIVEEKEDLSNFEFQRFPFDEQLSRLLPWWEKFGMNAETSS